MPLAIALRLETGALATSGDARRFLLKDGVRYGHILDPRTGWPVRGPASVTVLAPHCLIAGTASTVAMLSGEVGAARWLDSVGLPHARIDRDGGLSAHWELKTVALPRPPATPLRASGAASR